MLTEEEAKALERLRSHEADESDYETLAYALAADYSPDWNDPATPEGLVELGFEKSDSYSNYYDSRCGTIRIECTATALFEVWVDGMHLPSCMHPRNMKEAREILERCGAIGGVK